MRRRPMDGAHPEGEFISITERLVVSPGWGRFHGEPLEEGIGIPKGAVIGPSDRGRP